MKYIVIKEQNCSRCNGTTSISVHGRSRVMKCPECRAGKIRTEVDLETAIIDLINTTNVAVNIAKSLRL